MSAPNTNNLEVAYNVWMRGPKWVDSVLLVANVAQTYTVPAGGHFLLISGTGDIYVNWRGVAAAVPAGTTSDGSASELNPTQRMVNGGDTISIISAANCIVTIAAMGA